MVFIGIDPGKKGAYCIMNEQDDIKAMPWDEESFIDDMDFLCGYCGTSDRIFCVLEHVGAMPGQGTVSMFSFGENFGFIQGVLKAMSIPYELVRPQKWKKEYGITSDKNTSIEVCKRLFPFINLKRTERCKKDDDGIAEAILIAEYARRKKNNN